MATWVFPTPGGPGLELAVVAQVDPGGEELLDRLGSSDAAAVDAGEDAVEGFEGAGELEIGELGPDPVAAAWPLGGRHETPVVRRSYSARDGVWLLAILRDPETQELSISPCRTTGPRQQSTKPY